MLCWWTKSKNGPGSRAGGRKGGREGGREGSRNRTYLVLEQVPDHLSSGAETFFVGRVDGVGHPVGVRVDDDHGEGGSRGDCVRIGEGLRSLEVRGEGLGFLDLGLEQGLTGERERGREVRRKGGREGGVWLVTLS